jgi:hypothetical protein
MAFLKNCFEEGGSNLAILSGNYRIPKDEGSNPYGQGLVQMSDRMLTPDADQRSDMTEIIRCLSAVYSGKPLPPPNNNGQRSTDCRYSERVAGTPVRKGPNGSYKVKAVAKNIDPNSAVARRRAAHVTIYQL